MHKYYCDQCDKPVSWQEMIPIKIGDYRLSIYGAEVCEECADKVKAYIFSDAFKLPRPNLLKRLWRAL